MSGDLVAFLRARIEEDEKVARLAVERSTGEWVLHTDFHRAEVRDTGGRIIVHDNGRPIVPECAHIARHDPKRELDDVEAKRRIIDEIVPLIDRLDSQIESEWGGTGWMDMIPTSNSDALLKLLALPYADHPSYDEAWRP